MSCILSMQLVTCQQRLVNQTWIVSKSVPAFANMSVLPPIDMLTDDEGMALAPTRSQLKNQHLRSPTSHHPGPRGQPRPRLRPRPRRREQQRPPSPTRKGIPLLRRLLFPRRSRLMLVLHVFNLVCPRFKFPVLRVHLSARKWLWAHQ
jgi:hypothetical protein